MRATISHVKLFSVLRQAHIPRTLAYGDGRQNFVFRGGNNLYRFGPTIAHIQRRAVGRHHEPVAANTGRNRLDQRMLLRVYDRDFTGAFASDVGPFSVCRESDAARSCAYFDLRDLSAFFNIDHIDLVVLFGADVNEFSTRMPHGVLGVITPSFYGEGDAFFGDCDKHDAV